MLMNIENPLEEHVYINWWYSVWCLLVLTESHTCIHSYIHCYIQHIWSHACSFICKNSNCQCVCACMSDCQYVWIYVVELCMFIYSCMYVWKCVSVFFSSVVFAFFRCIFVEPPTVWWCTAFKVHCTANRLRTYIYNHFIDVLLSTLGYIICMYVHTYIHTYIYNCIHACMYVWICL